MKRFWLYAGGYFAALALIIAYKETTRRIPPLHPYWNDPVRIIYMPNIPTRRHLALIANKDNIILSNIVAHWPNTPPADYQNNIIYRQR